MYTRVRANVCSPCFVVSLCRDPVSLKNINKNLSVANEKEN